MQGCVGHRWSGGVGLEAAEAQVMRQAAVVLLSYQIQRVPHQRVPSKNGIQGQQRPQRQILFNGSGDASIVWWDDLAGIAPVHLQQRLQKAVGFGSR